MIGKSTLQTLQEQLERELLHGTARSPFGPTGIMLHARQDPAEPIYRVSADISMRHLMSSIDVRGLVNQITKQIAGHIAVEAVRRLYCGDFDALLKEVVREEMRAAVKQAVADRTDEFLEDLLA